LHGRNLRILVQTFGHYRILLYGLGIAQRIPLHILLVHHFGSFFTLVVHIP